MKTDQTTMTWTPARKRTLLKLTPDGQLRARLDYSAGLTDSERLLVREVLRPHGLVTFGGVRQYELTEAGMAAAVALGWEPLTDEETRKLEQAVKEQRRLARRESIQWDAVRALRELSDPDHMERREALSADEVALLEQVEAVLAKLRDALEDDPLLKGGA